MNRTGKSESQANADALDRRERTYSEASGVSFRVKWDWHKREPENLREAVRMVQAAYADEIPARLHGKDLADDGTPKMSPQAESYIFGNDQDGTLPTEADADGNPIRPIIDYYRTPFRAALVELDRHSPPRAAIVRCVAIVGTGPGAAATLQGVPAWCAKIVAEDVLRAFLRSVTDVKLHLPKEETAA